jgi:hypothetical protein
MPFPIAVVRFGKVTEIVMHRGQEVKRPRHPEDNTARLVNVDLRPDIKVGDSWPFTRDPNDLIHGHAQRIAVVKSGKVVQLIAPASSKAWRVVTTAGEQMALSERLAFNPLADGEVSLNAVDDKAVVNVGDSWPLAEGVN